MLTSRRNWSCSVVHREEGQRHLQEQWGGQPVEEHALPGDEGLVVVADPLDVGVSHDGPKKAGIVGGVGHHGTFDGTLPGHRLLGAELGEHLVHLQGRTGPERLARYLDVAIVGLVVRRWREECPRCAWCLQCARLRRPSVSKVRPVPASPPKRACLPADRTSWSRRHLQPVRHRLGTVGGTELAEDVLHVALDRSL